MNVLQLLILFKAAFMRIIGKRLKFRRRKKSKHRTENRARKALKTISIILGAFVACWTPYHILAIVTRYYYLRKNVLLKSSMFLLAFAQLVSTSISTCSLTLFATSTVPSTLSAMLLLINNL